MARRERVRKEVFKGTEIKGAHRSGSEWAALVILAYAATAYTFYAWNTNPLTGFLLGKRIDMWTGSVGWVQQLLRALFARVGRPGMGTNNLR